MDASTLEDVCTGPECRHGIDIVSAASPALLLDRDGTICEEAEFLDSPDKLKLIAGASTAIRMAQAAGFRVVVVTNQSGIARGLFSLEAVDRIHARLQTLLNRDGARLDATYVCPHHPRYPDESAPGECNCRKPEPGMLFRAGRDLGLDLSASYTVGDRYRDVLAGIRAGTRTVLVRTGYGTHELERQADDPDLQPDHVASDLRHAVDWILQQSSGQGATTLNAGAITT